MQYYRTQKPYINLWKIARWNLVPGLRSNGKLLSDKIISELFYNLEDKKLLIKFQTFLLLRREYTTLKAVKFHSTHY